MRTSPSRHRPPLREGLSAVAATLFEQSRTALLTSAGARPAEQIESPAVLAAATPAHRMGGRAEPFPGQEWLIDDLPVAEALMRTAIDEIRSTQAEFSPEAVLRAHGFVRPGYDDGVLVVRVGCHDPTVVTPWEVRYCRPCCGEEH